MLRGTGQATRPCAGETENGDLIVLREAPGSFLCVVLDALGHGPQAAAAARAADEHLAGILPGLDAARVLEGLHGALRGTRGAAATALRLDATHLEVCAIGNVGFRAEHVALSVVPVAGILGSRVRRFRLNRGPRPAHGRIVLFTDGISQRFELRSLAALSPQAAADALLASHGKDSDDATVVVLDV